MIDKENLKKLEEEIKFLENYYKNFESLTEKKKSILELISSLNVDEKETFEGFQNYYTEMSRVSYVSFNKKTLEKLENRAYFIELTNSLDLHYQEKFDSVPVPESFEDYYNEYHQLAVEKEKN